jgi:hypothetical protein
MAKPGRTTILTSHYDPTTQCFARQDVLVMTDMWFVCHDNKPVALKKTFHAKGQQNNKKYVKLIYPERGRAMLIANNLNKEYSTNKFKIVNLSKLFLHLKLDEFVDCHDQLEISRPKPVSLKPRKVTTQPESRTVESNIIIRTGGRTGRPREILPHSDISRQHLVILDEQKANKFFD